MDGTFGGDPSLARTLKSKQDEIDQLRRRLSRVVTPEPVAASSGGIVGQAEVFATNGTVAAASGASQMTFGAVTYNAPYDPNGGDAPDWITVDGTNIYLDPGWYGVTLFVRLGWAAEANAPTSYAVYMGGGFDTPHTDTTVVPRVRTSSSRWGLYNYINHGHVYAQGIDQGADYAFHVEIQFPAQTAGANSADGNIGWTFTKYA
jgi:hypothetical protein